VTRGRRGTQRRTRSRAAVAGAALAALVTASAPGSAAHLQVDGGVLQVFELDGPARDLAQVAECGDVAEGARLVHGTPGDDVIHGGNHPQVIVGYGGDDVLHGGNQSDCLLGGAGDDRLYGGNGNDVLIGGAGDDVLEGGNGKDVLDGTPER
jgi:Ca2+-binding RTX toxin-like protein